MYPDPHCSCFGYLRKTLVRAESVTKEATKRRNACSAKTIKTSQTWKQKTISQYMTRILCVCLPKQNLRLRNNCFNNMLEKPQVTNEITHLLLAPHSPLAPQYHWEEHSVGSEQTHQGLEILVSQWDCPLPWTLPVVSRILEHCHLHHFFQNKPDWNN